MPGGAPQAWPAGQRYPTIHCGQTARRPHRAAHGSDRAERDISSKPYTTASSMATCSLSRKPIHCSNGRKGSAARHTPDVQRLEPWRTEQFPDRNYGPDRQFQGERRRLPARPHPRRSRAERNRKMERHRRNGRKRPLTLITEAVYARMLSALKSQREQASSLFPPSPVGIHKTGNEPIRDALYGAKPGF